MIQITPNVIKQLQEKRIFEYLEEEVFKNVNNFNYNTYSSIRKKIQDKFNISENEADKIRNSFFETGSKNKYFLDNYDKLIVTAKKYLEFIQNKIKKAKETNPNFIENDFIESEFKNIVQKIIEVENTDRNEYYKRIFTFNYLAIVFDKDI